MVHGGQTQEIELDRTVLENMIDSRFFHVQPIEIPVTTESALLAIDLHLTNDSIKEDLLTGFPISGFPRSLADDEPLNRTSKPLHLNIYPVS